MQTLVYNSAKLSARMTCNEFVILALIVVELFFSNGLFFFFLWIFSWSFTYLMYFLRVPEKEFLKAFKAHPRLKTKVNNFHRQMASITNSEDEFVAIRPEWTTVDRIIACRFNHLKAIISFCITGVLSFGISFSFIVSWSLPRTILCFSQWSISSQHFG